MERIGIDELRSDMAEIFRKIETGEMFAIMSQRREVARLVPPDNEMEKARRTLGELRKTAVVGDIISPATEKWEAMG